MGSTADPAASRAAPAVRRGAIGVLLMLLPIPVLLGSLLAGPPGGVDAPALLAWLRAGAGDGGDPLVTTILLEVRLPRVLLAFLVGAALTVSGTALQAMFRNPLVSPDVLGLSAGAAAGAALALGIGWLPLQPAAFAGGLLAVGLTLLIARGPDGLDLVDLILAGIVVGGAATAILMLVQFFTDPFRLQSIVHWTMGNLQLANWERLGAAAGPILAGCAWLWLLRWRLNGLALGDAECRAVGVDPQREQLLVLLPATLVASSAVAVAGVIAMVGLAVPHLVRLLVGPDNRRAVPVGLALGGSLLVLMDDCARSFTGFELPVGIFTTLLGGPLFVVLLKRGHWRGGQPA